MVQGLFFLSFVLNPCKCLTCRPNREWLQKLKAAVGQKLAAKKYDRKSGGPTGTRILFDSYACMFVQITCS